MAHGHGPQVLLQHEIREGDKPAIDLDLWADGLKPITLHLPQDSTFAVHDFAPAPKIALAGNDKGEVLMLPLEPGQPPRHLAVADLREVWRAWLSPDGKLAGLVAQFGKDADFANGGGALIDTADGKILQAFRVPRGQRRRQGLCVHPRRDEARGRPHATARPKSGTPRR